MSLPNLLSVEEIRDRLEKLFPPGLEMRKCLVREMAAKTVYVFLYGGMVEGAARHLRPSHVYFFTEEQALKATEEERLAWLAQSVKPGFRPGGSRWYADTTREPIRDETIRLGLLNVGAVGKLPGIAVTSSQPIYFLRADFAAIFDPDLTEDDLKANIAAWQARHLTPAARARIALLSARSLKSDDEVLVKCPDGTTTKLSPGPSSIIAKAVIEQFASRFLTVPALLWLSESSAKVRYQDNKTAKALGLHIDQSIALPDIILADIGESGETTHLVFMEVVATDGPMNQSRREALQQYVANSGFPNSQCLFGTAFEDRAHGSFKKSLADLAWGTFVWFRSEPDCLVWLFGEPFSITSGLANPIRIGS